MIKKGFSVQMIERKKTKYILHVSDFHLASESIDFAQEGLRCLSDTLDKNDITVDYLIHTGDVIDAKDAHRIAADDLVKGDPSLSWITGEYVSDSNFDENRFKNDHRVNDTILEQINKKISENTNTLYQVCAQVIKEFLANIRVRKRHTYFCVGNHDTLRPIIRDKPQICDRFRYDDGDAKEYHDKLVEYERTYKIFNPYSSFLNTMGVSNNQFNEYADQTLDLNIGNH